MICLKSGKHGRDIFDFQQASSDIENWGHGGTNCHNHCIVYENDKGCIMLQILAVFIVLIIYNRAWNSQ